MCRRRGCQSAGQGVVLGIPGPTREPGSRCRALAGSTGGGGLSPGLGPGEGAGDPPYALWGFSDWMGPGQFTPPVPLILMASLGRKNGGFVDIFHPARFCG